MFTLKLKFITRKKFYFAKYNNTTKKPLRLYK